MLLMPMWMLSGSLFRLEEAHPAMQLLMRLNPMTYGISLLQTALGAGSPLDPVLALGVLTGWTALLLALAIVWVNRSQHAAA